jgi:hypothetical protein
LRQVANAHLCPLVHGLRCYVPVVQENIPVIRFNQAYHHIERSGFAGSIWSQQAYDLALVYFYRYVINNRSGAIAFDKIIGMYAGAQCKVFVKINE